VNNVSHYLWLKVNTIELVTNNVSASAARGLSLKMSKSTPISLLIHAVKRHPILWDSRLEDYKLSERKPTIWEAIAVEFGATRST